VPTQLGVRYVNTNIEVAAWICPAIKSMLLVFFNNFTHARLPFITKLLWYYYSVTTKTLMEDVQE